MNQAPSIGRIVHYHFTNQRGTEVVRPAIVVEAWDPKGPESLVNLQVFLDGSNDAAGHDLLWATSVVGHQGEGKPPGGHLTWWSWPPRA